MFFFNNNNQLDPLTFNSDESKWTTSGYGVNYCYELSGDIYAHIIEKYVESGKEKTKVVYSKK